ncbi:MAG: LPP20 family lipoprotein [Ignavibacteriales bacterium]|nr:LPP20 family lipoprotein [Ignavibacteriales bacterium]
MTKKWLLLFFIFPLAIFSQVAKISPQNYYIGYGHGQDLEKARSDAYHSLTQQIQVFVTSAINRRVTEDDKVLTENTVLSTITKSSLQLTDVAEIVENENNEYRVTKFISKENISKMFDIRRKKIIEHLNISESELFATSNSINLGVVLKNYYWALILSRIYPDTISYPFQQDRNNAPQTSSQLAATLPNRIESIINAVVFTPINKIDDEYVVWKCRVDYQSRSVGNLNFSFFDGEGQTEGRVVNGETKLSFYFKDNREREIDLKIDFKYEDEMDELLHLAEGVSADIKIPSNKNIVFSGLKLLPKRDKVKDSIPPVISELLKCRNDLQKTMQCLRDLAKQNKIIVGNDSTFISKERLYRLVLGEQGIIAFLQFKEKKYYDLMTQRYVLTKDYAGKRMTWIEVLK